MSGAAKVGWFAAGFVSLTALFVVVAFIGWNDDVEGSSDPSPFSGLEATIGDIYEDELNETRRRRRARGAIAVVDVNCDRPLRPRRLILCLADVAATGEAREIAPSPAVIRVRLREDGDFSFRTPDPRPEA